LVLNKHQKELEMNNSQKADKAAEMAADVIGTGIRVYADEKGKITAFKVAKPNPTNRDTAFVSLFPKPISRMSAGEIADEIVKQIDVR
jgi:hypothetical protein